MVKKDTFLFRFLTKQANRKIKEIEGRITEENKWNSEKEIALIREDLEESLKHVETINEDSDVDAVNDQICPNGLIDAFYDIANIQHSDANKTIYSKRIQRVINIYLKFHKIDDFDSHFYSNLTTVPLENSPRRRTNALNASPNIPKYILEYLLPFQTKSIQFFHFNRSNESGSILADEMGLGKTVQIISYLVSLSITTTHALKCLIICPVTLISHWMTEIRKIYPFFRVLIWHSRFNSDLTDISQKMISEDELWTDSHIDNSATHTNKIESPSTSKFFDHTIYITSYETYKIEHKVIIGKFKHFSNDLPVCVLDEAHKIKNPNSLVHTTILKLKEIINPLFLLLTGTPLQNNLIELYALMRMCNNILGGTDDYFNGLVRPIESEIKEIASQRNKDRKRIRKMQHNRKLYEKYSVKNDLGGRGPHYLQNKKGPSKLEYLKSLIAPYILRRTKKSHLSIKKREFVIPCPISRKQAFEYENFCEYILKQSKPGILKGVSLLRRVLNHPQSLTTNGFIQKFFEREKNEILVGEGQFGHLSWDELVKESGKMCVIHYFLNKWIFGKKKITFIEPSLTKSQKGTKKKHKEGKDSLHNQTSAQLKNKVLIFSQSLNMLSIMEEYLNRSQIQYLRLDGNTPVEKRDILVRRFNFNDPAFKKEDMNDFPSVFLLSTRAASLGINLSTANKIIIIDPDWNPSVDKQAMDRACRIGQSRSVTIIRLVCNGSVEECVLGKQVYKEILCGEVLRQTAPETKIKDDSNCTEKKSHIVRSDYSTLLDLNIKNSAEFLALTVTELFTLGDFKLIENFDFDQELKEYFQDDEIQEESDTISNISEKLDESFSETTYITKNLILTGKEMIKFIVEREKKYGD